MLLKPTVVRMNGDLCHVYCFLWNSCLTLHAEVVIAYPNLRKLNEILRPSCRQTFRSSGCMGVG